MSNLSNPRGRRRAILPSGGATPLTRRPHNVSDQHPDSNLAVANSPLLTPLKLDHIKNVPEEIVSMADWQQISAAFRSPAVRQTDPNLLALDAALEEYALQAASLHMTRRALEDFVKAYAHSPTDRNFLQITTQKEAVDDNLQACVLAVDRVKGREQAWHRQLDPALRSHGAVTNLDTDIAQVFDMMEAVAIDHDAVGNLERIHSEYRAMRHLASPDLPTVAAGERPGSLTPTREDPQPQRRPTGQGRGTQPTLPSQRGGIPGAIGGSGRGRPPSATPQNDGNSTQVHSRSIPK
jgi:hypothetical protein